VPDGPSRGGGAPDPDPPPYALTIDIAQDGGAWPEGAEALDRLIERAVAAALAAAAPRVPRADSLEVCVVLADDPFVHDLNNRYRGKDKATNVLSFPSGLAMLDPSAPRALGDVVLAFETVSAEAQAMGKALRAHVAHLVVHGTLHLLGYTHEDDEDGDIMTAAERAAMEAVGFSDPYANTEGAAA